MSSKRGSQRRRFTESPSEASAHEGRNRNRRNRRDHDGATSKRSRSPSFREKRFSRDRRNAYARSRSPCYSRSCSSDRQCKKRVSSERYDSDAESCSRHSHPHCRSHRRRLSLSEDEPRRRSRTRRKARQFRPNAGILAMLIRDQVRTNDRMDREEVRRADVALRTLDPNTTQRARLMTEYLRTGNAATDY